MRFINFKNMPRSIESQPTPEENEEIIRIGDREYKKGDLVNFNNGDGVEKDWSLIGFNDKEVKISKVIGEKESPSGKYNRNARFIDKTVNMDEFIELQNK